MNLPTAGGPLVGVVRLAHQPTTRRRAAVAATIPGSTMRRPVRCAPSQGHPAAHSRCAVPIREYQSGGRPTHSAATRRASSGTRDPPPPIPSLCTFPHHSSRSTSYVLAALRALHVDPSHAVRNKAATTGRTRRSPAQDLLDRAVPYQCSVTAIVGGLWCLGLVALA